MRLPSYLVRRTSGFTFRYVVPLHLRPVVGRKVIKHALHTTDRSTAQVKALALAVRYRRALGAMGSEMGKSLEELLSGAQAALDGGKTRDYTYRVGADGTVEMSADGAEDHRLLMETMKAFAEARAVPLPAVPQPVADIVDKPIGVPAGVKAITAGKALEAYLEVLAHKFKDRVKTYKKNKRVLEEFVRVIKPRTMLYNIARHDLAQYAQREMNKGLSLSSVNSTMIWLAGMFKWAMASGYYTDGRNPASGHVTVTAKDKRKAAARGWEEFSREQLKTLFSPENFCNLGNKLKLNDPRDRWVALIALYTGARSNEICLLELDDIVQDGEAWLIDFNLMGEFKHLKTFASERKVLIHPDLIALGLLDRVAVLRKERKKFLFPGLTFDAENGPANAPQRAFIRYLERKKIKPRAGKMGLHSFRDTVINQMKRSGVSQDWREQYVGHEQSENSTLDTSHAISYSVETPHVVAEKCHPSLCWSAHDVVDVAALKPLLTTV
ncbi:DUF6538 domain-containing protein [Stenotrophomonas acidaminiphila]|jgi:integrase